MHIIAYIASTHALLSPPSTIFFTSPGDDRRAPVSDLEAGGREREAAEAEPTPSHCVFLCKAGLPGV